MEDKYYTPDIESLYIGYQYQWKIGNACIGYEWVDKVINNVHEFAAIPWRMENRTIRSKYLDKSDIESEGWVYDHSISAGLMDSKILVYKKERNQVIYRLEKHTDNSSINISGWFHDNIRQPITQTLFRGQCPSINELKQIEKLLRIN